MISNPSYLMLRILLSYFLMLQVYIALIYFIFHSEILNGKKIVDENSTEFLNLVKSGQLTSFELKSRLQTCVNFCVENNIGNMNDMLISNSGNL